ncbi:uncharacterized protein LOC110437213 [Sorghum bicolor]|uniref:uncharacterized protein LOC110437213 n=1 Tax=Sorghum bicolor TaxID=4558 RepID=UPI000B42456D|nr:uncharacterized protein LOC110437213 [Sorghum bicolor]|eukprot:XP_021321249.1 uncharacterized protein LOC110437213 [Sorghum bicolor]
MVLKLNKALYGLKQAPRAWNAKLDYELCRLGFRRCEDEHAVYRRRKGDSFLIAGVYVDDLIICGPDKTKIINFKQQMMKLFSMSDLGLLSYYLGIEVQQKNGEITICQSAYATKIVHQCGLSRCNPTNTPMELRVRLVSGTADKVLDGTRYRSVIGSLRYLVNTKPDIAFVVGLVSRFMESPNSEHWAVVKRIVRYVSGTIDYGCKFTKEVEGGLNLLGYRDSDHGGDLIKRRSTNGLTFFLGRNLVTWSSQKQKVVTLSTCEAEYVAACGGACQGVWLNRLIADLMGREVQKFRLLVDNKSAIELSKNLRTKNQLADILTKALPRIRFVELQQRLGIIS